MCCRCCSSAPCPHPRVCALPSCGSQVWPNIYPCSVLLCQNWPVVPACWGLCRPNFLAPHISGSSQLPVLSKSDPHAVSGFGQAIDKNNQEGEAERRALDHTSRDPLRFSSPGRGHCLRRSLPEVPICSQKFQCQLSQRDTDIQCQGESPKPGEGTKAGLGDWLSGNPQWVPTVIRAMLTF